MVIFLASVAAVAFAAGSVLAKRGMQNTGVLTALILTSGVAAVILAVGVAFDPPGHVSVRGMLFFAAAGIAGDGVGRFSMLGAVDRVGPSLAIPIQTAVYPLIAVSGGVLVLAESVTWVQVVGAITIVGGIWVLLAPAPGELDAAAGKTTRGGFRWSVLPLPVMAGIGFAVSDLFRKSGMEVIPNAAFGALVAVGTMLLVLVTTTVTVPSLRLRLTLGPGWAWLVGAGVSIAVALLSLFAALEGGAVSAVGPINAAQPLAVVALSWLLLNSIERVTGRIVVGAALVVLGVVLIAVSA